MNSLETCLRERNEEIGRLKALLKDGGSWDDVESYNKGYEAGIFRARFKMKRQKSRIRALSAEVKRLEDELHECRYSAYGAS